MSRHSHKTRLTTDIKNTPQENSFVVYGTPFPELREGDEDSVRSVPIWKQEVRDEKGRRRFHGAFTGGFSAGYFNTVGSKEGWAPSQFSSSRSNRSNKKTLRPEDFMDEEDLADLASKRKLVATDDFDAFGGTAKELARKQAAIASAEESGGLIAGRLMADLIVPSKDPVGVRLLKRMGWREGQGIGPRILGKKRKLAPGDMDLEDEYAKDVYFAPKDKVLITFENKNNTFGIGYEPGQRGLSARETNREQEQLMGMSGGIGFGALEDEDDDEDVFSGGAKLSDYYATLGVEEGDEESYRIGGKGRRATNHSIKTEDVHSGKRALKRKCNDGRFPIEGFVIAQHPTPLTKWFAPPEIPATYVATPIFSLPAPIPAPESSERTQKKALTAEERGSALGERPLEGPARSVFDYMPSKSKEKLDSLLGFFIDTQGERPPKSSTAENVQVNPEIARAALQGFLPFEGSKQKRYRQFLEEMANGRLIPDKPKEMSEEAWLEELREFSQSARMFRPISSMMASRFTAASGSTADTKPAKVTEETQREDAAKMGMFGALTRRVMNFYPNRMMCKRFNVRDPHPDRDLSRDAGDKGAGKGGRVTGVSEAAIAGRTLLGSREVLRQEEVERMLLGQNGEVAGIRNASSDVKLEESSATVATVNNGADKNKAEEVDPNDPMNYERPAMDIFKAIFESEGEDDEDDENEDEEEMKNNELEKPANDEQLIKPLLHNAIMEHAPVSTVEPQSEFRPRFTPQQTQPQLPASRPAKIKTRAPIGPMSFAMEDEDGENESDKERERERERRKKKKRKERKRSISDTEESSKRRDRKKHRKQGENESEEEKDNRRDERVRRRKGEENEKSDMDGIWVEKTITPTLLHAFPDTISAPEPTAVIGPALPPSASMASATSQNSEQQADSSYPTDFKSHRLRATDLW
ncbi:uncharacterized protein VTP21DRAFT_9034 [Calcarisporiella thermophila]|uniref:uncharacterized protein n=1 Tax=Calcarisporiella thermophila TaxID=911321 RepID=UPI003743FBF5